MSSSSLVEVIGRPSAVIASGPLVIRETVYGIVKRLDFFIQHIETYRARNHLTTAAVSILDVGCGTGVNVAIPLAEAGYSVVGLDPNADSIKRGRELSVDRRNIRFYCGALNEQRFSQKFNVVVCSEVLEHLREPDALLQDVYSVLKEDGLLLVTVPNGFGFFELDSLLWRLICRFRRLEENLYGYENKFWRLFGSDKIQRRRAEEYKPERLMLTWSTLAPETDHHQSFTSSKIIRLLSEAGFNVSCIRNNTFLAGNLLGFFVRELDFFLRWNCRIADRLPRCLVSAWLIAAEKSGHGPYKGRR
jgi:SAM-dependent methyltransferase